MHRSAYTLLFLIVSAVGPIHSSAIAGEMINFAYRTKFDGNGSMIAGVLALGSSSSSIYARVLGPSLSRYYSGIPKTVINYTFLVDVKVSIFRILK